MQYCLPGCRGKGGCLTFRAPRSPQHCQPESLDHGWHDCAVDGAPEQSRSTHQLQRLEVCDSVTLPLPEVQCISLLRTSLWNTTFDTPGVCDSVALSVEVDGGEVHRFRGSAHGAFWRQWGASSEAWAAGRCSIQVAHVGSSQFVTLRLRN